MATPAFEEIAETFSFLDEEGRFQEVIVLGRSLPAMEDALKVEETKLPRCNANVWFYSWVDERGKFIFQAESDSKIVQGIIFILGALFQDLTPKEILNVDAEREFARLELQQHMVRQRANTVPTLIDRIRSTAHEAVERATT
jgi:cysteine desulfuration protein SufE